MLFSDPLFVFIFLPISIAGFAFFGRFGRNTAIGFLAFVSLFFYAQWCFTISAWGTFQVLIWSILFNYGVARAIAASAKRVRRQSAILIGGITCNLLMLGYFKYLTSTLNYAHSLGLTQTEWPAILLPLGISFFTFTQIAYLVDLKQGVAKRESLLSYFLFVTYFPHLIAGPILHHKEIMPQFREERRYGLDANDVAVGLTWFAMGMFKKVMIADRIAPYANVLFMFPRQAAWNSWSGALMYAMQLYFDFSGYSDMAVGLARIFSIRFPLNFDSPYKSQSVIEYWQRWHMTLTRYIMAYLYSPFLFWISARRQAKGKKVSKKAQATLEGFASMIAGPTFFTMFLAGVWHGAGAHFFAFGLLHGLYITGIHAWRTALSPTNRLRQFVNGPVAVLITFAAVLAGDIMFRSAGLHDTFTIYKGMLGFHGKGVMWPAWEFLVLALLFAIVWLMPNTQEIFGEEQRDDDPNWSLIHVSRWRPSTAWWLVTSAIFLISMAFSTRGSTFLYFQF